MKKLILSTAMAMVVAAGAYAQGLIAIDNNVNSSLNQAATSGGLFWKDGALLNADANLTLLAGADVGSLAPLKTFLLSNGSATGSSAAGPGTWTDLTGGTYAVPGVAAGAAGTFEVQIWLGDFSSYAAAAAGGAYVGMSTPFTQTLGGGSVLPSDLTAMPAVTLAPIPEPSTIALAGLGAAALLIFRRRN